MPIFAFNIPGAVAPEAVPEFGWYVSLSTPRLAIPLTPSPAIFYQGEPIIPTPPPDFGWFKGLSVPVSPILITPHPDIFYPGEPITPPVASGVIGFASINALGQDGTTGGGDTTPTVVTTKAGLDSAVAGNSPKVVEFSTTITDSGSTSIGSNTTLLGVGANAKIDGFGLRMGSIGDNVQNIVLQNFTIDNQTGTDQINAAADDGSGGGDPSGTHHIWIDHVTFVGPGGDGSLDLTQGTTYWTVSWCHFQQCNKTMLSGRHNGSPPYEAPGSGRGTFHHNWWDKCFQRQPFIQEFGWAHCFNNYYDIDSGNFSRAIDLGDVAEGVVESNYFKDCSSCVRVRESSNRVRDGGDNVFDNSTAFSEQDEANCFVPSDFYSYTPDAGSTINTVVPAGAGVGNL